MTCQCQRLSQCSLGKLYVITRQLFADFRLAIVKTLHTLAHDFASFSQNSSLRHVDCFQCCIFSFWRYTDPWKWANQQLPVFDQLGLFGADGCFWESEDRCYSSLWNQSVARPEVTTISALQSDIILIQKQLQRVFGGFTAEQLLNTF